MLNPPVILFLAVAVLLLLLRSLWRAITGINRAAVVSGRKPWKKQVDDVFSLLLRAMGFIAGGVLLVAIALTLLNQAL